MATLFDSIASRRAIIDRRAIADNIAVAAGEHQGDSMKLRQAIVAQLRDALAHGRIEVARRLIANPSRGRESAGGQAFLID
jgi:[protein-PII] uridylyltransferase